MTLLFLMLHTTSSAASDPQINFNSDNQVWADTTTPFAVDSEGTQGGQDVHWQGRSRNLVQLENESVSVNLGFDALSGQFAGATTNNHPWIDQRARFSNGIRYIELNQLNVVADLDVAQIQTGLTTSHWGLGMLANDGHHDPMFGHTNFGDKVLRARITTKPSTDSPWHISAAVDRVVEDDLTVFPDLQWTQQGILSALYAKKDVQFGLYGVGRRQTELYNNRETRVGVLDAFADISTSLSKNLKLQTAFEVAGISGKSNRSTTYESPERVHIRSAGATGIVNLIAADKQRVGLAGGWASGDGDPADNVSNDFTFDRDFGVGMVLFREVLGGVDEATYTLLTDPAYAGQAPDGVEASVHEGAFRRASYLQPQASFSPLDWVELRTAVLMAWSTAPIRQPFYTHRNGGVPVNHHGDPTSDYHLGTEVDWGIVLGDIPVSDRFELRPSLSIQGGHAFLGDAIDEKGQNTRVDRHIALIRIR